MDPGTNAKCWAAHTGYLSVEEFRFRDIVAQVKSGLWPKRASIEDEMGAGAQAMPPKPLYDLQGDVAVLTIDGVTTRGESKFGGTTSTARIRRGLRAAVADAKVESILLRVNSPGGYVDGTGELADEIHATATQTKKPVIVHVEGMAASAAYWAISGATKVYADRHARIGSIGVYAVVEDLSKAAEMAGVVVHIIKAGEAKGDGEPGTPITSEMKARWQREVDETAEMFKGAIRRGRQGALTPKQVEAVATGETWLASDAVEKGLIDGVRTIEETVAKMPRPRRARAADLGARMAAEE